MKPVREKPLIKTTKVLTDSSKRKLAAGISQGGAGAPELGTTDTLPGYQGKHGEQNCAALADPDLGHDRKRT